MQISSSNTGSNVNLQPLEKRTDRMTLEDIRIIEIIEQLKNEMRENSQETGHKQVIGRNEIV